MYICQLNKKHVIFALNHLLCYSYDGEYMLSREDRQFVERETKYFAEGVAAEHKRNISGHNMYMSTNYSMSRESFEKHVAIAEKDIDLYLESQSYTDKDKRNIKEEMIRYICDNYMHVAEQKDGVNALIKLVIIIVGFILLCLFMGAIS